VHITMKLALVASMAAMAVGPTSATFWNCPEIDGSAGASATRTTQELAL